MMDSIPSFFDPAILQQRTTTQQEQRTGKRMDSMRPLEEFTLYRQRWFVLASYSVLSCSSAWMWITWSPIAALLTELWDVPLSAVAGLSGVYMYVYVPFSFVSLNLVVNHLGLRRGLILGGFLNATGAAIRYVYFDDYQSVYVGTLFCALAQTFTLSTPPLIAGSWFGADERATSTALGVLANQMGTALGLGAAILVDFSDSSSTTEGDLDPGTLQAYLKFQFVISCIALASVILFSGSIPPTPPSLAAQMTRYNTLLESKDTTSSEETPLLEKSTPTLESSSKDTSSSEETPSLEKSTPTYQGSVLMVFRDATSLAFVLSFGLTVGVYYTVPTFLSQLLSQTWSARSIGWLGVIYQLVGVAGSFVAGRVMDITQQHRKIALVCLVGAAVFLALFFVMTALSDILSISWLAAGSIGLAGVCLSAFNTVGLELGTGMSFPADEAAVAGILESAAELGGFLWVSIGGTFVDASETSTQSADQIALLLVCSVAVALCILLSFPTEVKRPSSS
jgi:MFS family permease